MYACFSSLHVHPFGGLPLGLAPGFFWAGLEFLLPNGRPRFFFSTPLSVAAAAFCSQKSHDCSTISFTLRSYSRRFSCEGRAGRALSHTLPHTPRLAAPTTAAGEARRTRPGPAALG